MKGTRSLLAVGCVIAFGWCGVAGAAEVTYSSWQWGEPANHTLLSKLKAEFEKDNPGDTIKPVSPPYDGFFDKQYTEVRAGSSSDIVTLFDPDMAAYLRADLLEPLDEYVKAAGISLDQLNPSHKHAMKDGHIYGVTLGVNPRGLIANGQMLEDAGVSMPTNIDEFLGAIKKLRNPARQQFGFASWATSGAAQDLYLETFPIVAGFGGQWFKDGKPTANSPETTAALKFIKELYAGGLVPRVDSNTSRQMFIENKMAMQINGPYLVGWVAEQNKDVFQTIETATLPLPGNRTTAVSVFLGIPKTAKNKDAAGRYLTTLLKPEMQRAIVETVTSIPAVKGSVSEEFLARNPWFKAFVKAADTSVSFAPDGVEEYGPELYKIIGPAVEDMLFNDKDAEQVANQLQDDLTQFVASKRAN